MSTTKTRIEGYGPKGKLAGADDAFPRELEEQFIPLIRGVLKRFKEQTAGISPAGLFVLNQIATQERATAKEIAKSTHISTAAVSQLIAGLIESGMVLRERSEEDRRVFHLVPSEAGGRTIEDNRRNHLEILTTIFSCLSLSERSEFVRLLCKVRAHNPELA